MIKFIPVKAAMTLNDCARIVKVRSWHEKRMQQTKGADYERHRQIWKECDRRLDQYDQQVSHGQK